MRYHINKRVIEFSITSLVDALLLSKKRRIRRLTVQSADSSFLYWVSVN